MLPAGAEHHPDALRHQSTAGASGAAPEGTPLRRHAKALRQVLFYVRARITRSARKTIPYLPDRFRHLHVFQATHAAAYALAPQRSPRRRRAAAPALLRNPAQDAPPAVRPAPTGPPHMPIILPAPPIDAPPAPPTG
jgi:hypothetical protein